MGTERTEQLHVFHRSPSGAAAYADFVAARRGDILRTEVGNDRVLVWTRVVADSDGFVLISGYH